MDGLLGEPVTLVSSLVVELPVKRVGKPTFMNELKMAQQRGTQTQALLAMAKEVARYS